MMKSTIIFALLYCLAAASNIQAQNIEQQKDEIKPRILNGIMARPGEFQYQACLAYSVGTKYEDGSGALISYEYVLTAAQTAINAEGVIVFLGTITRVKGPVQLNVTKANIIIHPKFDRRTLVNDIALIKLPRFDTKNIRPIPLPKAGETIPSDAVATVTGWGYVSQNPIVVPNILRHIDVNIISNRECQSYYGKNQIGDSRLCTFHDKTGVTCAGDNGGPLVLKSSNVIVGITSFNSEKGCGYKAPDGFTRVSFYLDWIKGHTGIAN